MTVTKRAGGVLLAAATAAATVAVFAAPAMASTILTVKVSGGGSFTATATKTVLKDGAVAVVCTSTKTKPASKATGSIKSGTYKGKAPLKVGTTTKLAFNNCTGPLGPVSAKPGKLPYKVEANSKTNSKGQTDAIISGANVSVNAGSGCTFKVTGAAPGYWNNKTHQLVITSKLPVKPLTKAQLTLKDVSPTCLVIHNGDHPSYTSTYKVSRKITIKST